MAAFYAAVMAFFFGTVTRQLLVLGVIFLLILGLIGETVGLVRLAQDRENYRQQAIESADKFLKAQGKAEKLEADLEKAAVDRDASQAKLAAAQSQLAASGIAPTGTTATASIIAMPAFSQVKVNGLTYTNGKSDSEKNQIVSESSDEELSFLRKRQFGAPQLNIQFNMRLSGDNLVGRWSFQPANGPELSGLLEMLWPKDYRRSGQAVVAAFGYSYQRQMGAPGDSGGSLLPAPAPVTP